MSKDFLKKKNPHQVSREGEGRYSTELWAEEAVNNIEDRANSSQPWFLQVGVGELLFFVICVPGGVLCTKGALPGMKVFVPLKTLHVLSRPQKSGCHSMTTETFQTKANLMLRSKKSSTIFPH